MSESLKNLPTKNPFKVGDKVRLTGVAWDRSGTWYLSGYSRDTVTTVTEVEGNSVITSADTKGDPAHYSHFELVTEETKMTKTKRIPFDMQAWEKWKDEGGKVIYTPTGHEVLQLACFPEATLTYRYIFIIAQNAHVIGNDGSDLSLEIPVETKRIPFNPALRDAKVFWRSNELTEWVQMKSGVVCGTYIDVQDGMEETLCFHPNALVMEVEE